MVKRGTTPKAVTMARLLSAAFCDAANGNNEPYKRFFTPPTMNAEKGIITVSTVRTTSRGYEAVKWEAVITVRELETKPIDKKLEAAVEAVVDTALEQSSDG